MERPSYRPDVDGLRAVAVLLVMADHFGLRLRGGYVGVDIFFVISGYLISGIILAELAQDRFSIVRFYERRLRRIFPALLVMLAVVTCFVYQLFVPTEIEAFAVSVLATLLSISNFLFWHQAGYFDEASLIKPLLHTWSLAVEEQFYILFPLFLVAVRRLMPTRLKASIIGLAVLSFAAAVLTVRSNPTAAFFFAPLRAWELLLGTMISQRYFPVLRGAMSRNLASAAGFAMILVPAFVYRSTTPFPGLAALSPCLGAALLIAAGETGSSAVGRILSLRPVVFIGLISYSVYLWHWPILVFERTNFLLHLNLYALSTKLLLLGLSLVAGWLSWLFIEQPFRQGRFRPGRRAVFLINGVAVAFMAVVAGFLIKEHGFPNRFPPDARQVASFTDYYKPALYREGTCFITPDNTFRDFRPDTCLTRTPGQPSILLAGDSHAAQLWPGFASAFPGDSILQVSASGCPPLLQEPATKSSSCRQMFSFLFDDYLPHNPVNVLVLTARWEPWDMDALGRTIAYAHALGLFVVVVGPSIEYDVPLPRMLATAMRAGDTSQVEQRLTSSTQALDKSMAMLAASRWNVPYISVFNNLCTPRCPLFAAPNVPLLFDTDHFTVAGSVLFATSIYNRNQLTGKQP